MAEESAAVYVSWLTFKNSIEALSHGVPNTITRSAFPGLSGGVQNQLFAGLKFLGLIDEQNKPTANLHALAVPEEAKRKEKLKELLQECYSELFALNLLKTTPDELNTKMASAYNVNGDTKGKAVRFFLSAVAYLGIPVSRFIKLPGSSAPTNGKPARRRNAGSKPKPGGSSVDQSQAPNGTSRAISLSSGGMLTINASLDLFSLSTEDRQFVFGLIDALAKYEKEAATATPK